MLSLGGYSHCADDFFCVGGGVVLVVFGFGFGGCVFVCFLFVW